MRRPCLNRHVRRSNQLPVPDLHGSQARALRQAGNGQDAWNGRETCLYEEEHVEEHSGQHWPGLEASPQRPSPEVWRPETGWR